jgi:hypothetical protein
MDTVEQRAAVGLIAVQDDAQGRVGRRGIRR